MKTNFEVTTQNSKSENDKNENAKSINESEKPPKFPRFIDIIWKIFSTLNIIWRFFKDFGSDDF